MKLINLQLDENTVNLVLGALAELPYKISADAIMVIRNQAVPQVQQVQEKLNECSKETKDDEATNEKATLDSEKQLSE